MNDDATVVTGASRGIGAAIAARLHARGQRVIGVARTRPKSFPGPFVEADLGDPSAKTALRAIAEEFAPTRLVANAGIAIAGALDKITDEDFDQTIRINLRSTIWAMQAFTPAMRAARFGRIALIGSRAALGKTERGAYSASKAALSGLARTAALELAGDGITVNVVSPGPIETEMFNAHQPHGSEVRARLEALIPAGRVGRPEEIAAAVEFFLSEDSGFVTGQTLYACGGMSL